MLCRSVRQGTEPHRTAHGLVHRLTLTVFLLSGPVGLGSSSLTWAAVYQCLDAEGKTVLSNKQSEFHKCRVLTQETPAAATPPGASMTPQGSTPSVDSELPPTPSVPPMTLNRPADQDPAIRSQPPSNAGASSSPSQLRPCSHGLNPLNPLSSPPCVGSDQAGAKPPGAAPIPSQ